MAGRQIGPFGQVDPGGTQKLFLFKTSTFRDLNLQLGPRSQTKKRDMTKSGFNKITPEEHDRRGGSAYRRALHDLCCDIFESAGLEVMPGPLYSVP